MPASTNWLKIDTEYWYCCDVCCRCSQQSLDLPLESCPWSGTAQKTLDSGGVKDYKFIIGAPPQICTCLNVSQSEGSRSFLVLEFSPEWPLKLEVPWLSGLEVGKLRICGSFAESKGSSLCLLEWGALAYLLAKLLEFPDMVWL